MEPVACKKMFPDKFLEKSQNLVVIAVTKLHKVKVEAGLNFDRSE